MSTENTPEQDLTVETEQDDDLVKHLRAQLKQERDGRIQAERGLAEQSKKEVFKELGISVDSGPGKLLYQHYEGDVSPDAIKNAAEEYGILNAQDEQPAQQEQPQQHPDREAHEALARDRGTEGRTPPPSTDERAWNEYETLVNSGKTNEEAMAGYFSSKLQAVLEDQNRGA